MEGVRQEVTLFWSIENYSFCWHGNAETLTSPRLSAEGLEGTAWTLGLYPRGVRCERTGFISVFLNRCAEDEGPYLFMRKFELSFLAGDGSPLCSLSCESGFSKGAQFGKFTFLKMNEVLLQRKEDFLPKDVLTVCCKIWKGEGTVHSIGQCHARTRIKVERISFHHVVENFSALRPNLKQRLKVRSHFREQSFISSTLYSTEGLCCEEKIMIEIDSDDANQILLKSELYLLDRSGNEVECGKSDNRIRSGKIVPSFPLSLTREAVLSRKRDYLPADRLSLLCECTFSSGIEFQSIEETRHAIGIAAENRVYAKKSGNSTENASSYRCMIEDMKSLYANQCLTDVELKTKTRSFPAHKLVLCARSPVFHRMLTNEMEEKRNSCITIDDLEEEVVQQLLFFLYSDTTEDLEWTMATRLYYAADKYEVGKLKNLCSSFLLANLTPDNAAELLFLSDIHTDTRLKESVEEFILEHDKEVFGSKEWERWMKVNPLFFMKTMLLKYHR